MSIITKPDFQTVIQERHSVRQYDPSVKIPREEMEAILKDATLAPSSSNLRPWRFLVIDDAELLKKRIRLQTIRSMYFKPRPSLLCWVI